MLNLTDPSPLPFTRGSHGNTTQSTQGNHPTTPDEQEASEAQQEGTIRPQRSQGSKDNQASRGSNRRQASHSPPRSSAEGYLAEGYLQEAYGSPHTSHSSKHAQA